MTTADVSAFLDGIMPQQLAREDIGGAVVLVVKDGKILFAKGYGYADIDKKTPVTPDGTLFRIASISKLFTWTAVMQLVEQGKLDLDRDVNDYLDFKIPPTYAKPITLRNIMTHTAGFAETFKDKAPPSPSELKPLGDYLKTHVPKRIFPPGVTPAYSNYGASLAGYIVQRVSGQPFDDYIEQHIMLPLGMQHTTFRQPLPETLKPMMSSGYTVASAPAEPFQLAQDAPAGSASITAMDIKCIADGGAYASMSPFVTWRSVVQATGPYYCENVKTDVFAVYTNNNYTGAMRGFGVQLPRGVAWGGRRGCGGERSCPTRGATPRRPPRPVPGWHRRPPPAAAGPRCGRRLF